jgi:hypothetical protein
LFWVTKLRFFSLNWNYVMFETKFLHRKKCKLRSWYTTLCTQECAEARSRTVICTLIELPIEGVDIVNHLFILSKFTFSAFHSYGRNN